MKLPNAEHAFIDVAKLRDYCLSPEHPKGKHKARVFLTVLGINQNDADELRRIILGVVLTADAIEEEATEYGRRFVVDFRCPGNRLEALLYDPPG
jgi:hypothetical protein